MKKYLLFLVAAMLATVARAAVGDTFIYEGLKYEVTSEDDHTVAVGENSVSGDISIPSFAVNGSSRYSVTKIGSRAFYSCESLTSVGIPNSVTEIGEGAFYDCKSLTSVTIPNSVTTIGRGAFSGCGSLTSVTIPNSVTTIEVAAFFGCGSLTSVTIPNSVTTIGRGAFSGCGSLTSVTIPNSVTEIGAGAFSVCSSLASVDIPTSVTVIGERAFESCNNLTSVTIPNSVTEIGKSAFANCGSLSEIVVENGNPNYSSEDGVLFNIDKTELITCPGGKEGGYSIPNSVTTIRESAFSNCESLTSVTISHLVTTIGELAFYECSSLTSVDIPNSVTTIGTCVFFGCRNLTSVTIPKSVTEIGDRPFYGCRSLSEIVVENGNPNYSSEDGVLFNIDKTELIACPGGKEGEYSIPTSVNKIGEFAFCWCSNLTSVTIPKSVTEIGNHAFDACSSLTSVTIPYSVTTIGGAAFFGCHSLTSVIIPNSVTEIGYQAFYGCSNLKTIYDLNSKPQLVGEEAFQNVPNNVIIYIPKGSYDAYSRSNGWTQFSDFREMGAFDVALSEQTLTLNPGNTATVTATVTKDDEMSVESEEWTSSNPEVATVDNGVITAVAPGEAVIWFTAVDGYGVPHTEACKVTVGDKSGVAEIETDTDASVDVYNLQGVAVLRNAAATELRKLPAGLYIVRQGKSVKKIIVK